MTWPERKCEGCTAILPAQARGRRRKWCTNKCRRETLYSQPCMDCGGHTDPSNGRKAEPRCVTCANRHNIAIGNRADMKRRAAREELIWSMWADGASRKQIATKVGTSPDTIGSDMARMRRKGVDLPYRRPAGPTERRVAA